MNDTSDVNVKQIGLELLLESVQCDLHSSLRRAAERLFYRDGPATAKLRSPISSRVFGTAHL